MKALVTGGLGLIGSHIAMRLLQEGYQVNVLDIRPKGEFSLGTLPEAVEFYQGDVCDQTISKVAVIGCEVVFHTAAIARTAETIDDPRRAHEVNATATLQLLEIAKRFGVKRFVHSSSSIVYVGPTTPYAVSKTAAEDYVTLYETLYGLSTISLRYANVYGPGQRRDGAYPNVLASFARDKEEKGYITIFGDGSVTRDFVHVDDVVAANLIAMKSRQVGPFDICSGEYQTVKKLAELFDCEIRYAAERPGDTKLIALDPRRAREVLGFQAQVLFNKQSISSYL